jgi:hypothetical protein
MTIVEETFITDGAALMWNNDSMRTVQISSCFKTMQLHMAEIKALVHITICTQNKTLNNHLTFGRHFVGYNHLSSLA